MIYIQYVIYVESVPCCLSTHISIMHLIYISRSRLIRKYRTSAFSISNCGQDEGVSTKLRM